MPAAQPDEIALALGRRLTARREAADLRVADLARRAHVSGPYLSQLEAGERVPSYRALHRLADALGCLVGDLTDDDVEVVS